MVIDWHLLILAPFSHVWPFDDTQPDVLSVASASIHLWAHVVHRSIVNPPFPIWDPDEKLVGCMGSLCFRGPFSGWESA